jgi:hypothetical protein
MARYRTGCGNKRRPPTHTWRLVLGRLVDTSMPLPGYGADLTPCVYRNFVFRHVRPPMPDPSVSFTIIPKTDMLKSNRSGRPRTVMEQRGMRRRVEASYERHDDLRAKN